MANSSNANAKPSSSLKRLDFPSFLSFCKTHWLAVAISVICFTALGIAYAYRTPDRFMVESNVLITDNDKESDLMRASGLGDLFGATASAEEELTVINSYTLFRNVCKELGLNKSYVQKRNLLKRVNRFTDTPIEIIAHEPEMADTFHNYLALKVKVNDKGLVSVTGKNAKGKKVVSVKNQPFPVELKTIYGDFTLMKTKNFEEGKDLKMNIGFGGYDGTAEDLREEVKCFLPSKKANMITVSYKTADVAQGKLIIDEIVDEYNARDVEKERQKAQRIANFINERLDAYTGELASTEGDIESYKQSNRLTSVTGDVEYDMMKKGRLETNLIEAEGSLDVLKLIQKTLDDPNERYSLLPSVVGTGTDALPISEYNSLILKRMRVESQAKGDNAVLRTLNASIEAMRGNISTSLKRTLEAQQLKVDELRARMNTAQGSLGRVPKIERSYRNLERQREINENIYVFLMREREQTNMRISNALPKGVIIDQAYASTKPVGLSSKIIVIVFFLLGWAFIPGCYFLRDKLRNIFKPTPATATGEA